MSATDTLRNDRQSIISIVGEHYLDSDRLRKAMIYRFDKRPLSRKPIIHGAWEFVYDDKQNVIYIQ